MTARQLAPLLLVVTLVAGCGGAGGDRQPAATGDSAACSGEEILVTDAWVRAAPSGQGTTAAYFTVCNSDDENELVGVDTVAADTIELHETTRDESGVASMAAIASVPLGPKEQVSFAPGGKHVMLIGVREALEAGKSVPLTLHFQDGSQIRIDAAIRAADESAHAH